MLTKTARIADKAAVSVTGADAIRKDLPSVAPPRQISELRAMGQGDLHPNELYS